MRLYTVPFSTDGEERLAFSLTTRQVMIVGSGVLIGVIIAGLLSLILNTFMIFCLPAVTPFAGGAFILATHKVKRLDQEMFLSDYYMKKLKYKRRPRHYLRPRSN